MGFNDHFYKIEQAMKINSFLNSASDFISISLMLIGILFLDNATAANTDVKLPEDIANITQAVGNPDADAVIVWSQGGPTLQLSAERFTWIFRNVDQQKTFLVNVHQTQTRNPQRISDKVLSFDEAKAADDESTALLSKVVKHFISQGKKVYVVGYSFGAFAVTNLLVKDGPEATGYLILASRLDMPDEVWTAYAKGIPVRFSGDKVVPYTAEEIARHGGINSVGIKNTLALAAGVGYKRFTQLLNGSNLSKVVYGYGLSDQAVGTLNPAEIRFLGAQKIKRLLAVAGGHDDVINGLVDEGLAILMK